ncbi:MAG: hypothetical protein P1V51_16280 [Deltaproteobacteria bacterium]|nr:hypothetical protein [Deltaproteobacteria bacterium]
MIVECGHCGAPLDVKGESRTTRCAYCGTPNAVGSATRISLETPAGWQPPAQWTPPAHSAAGAGSPLPYQARQASRIIVAVAAGVAVMVMGVVVFVITLAGGAVEQSTSFAVTTSTASRASSERALQQAAQALEQARAQVEAVERQVGGARPEGAGTLLSSAGVAEALAAYEAKLGAPLALLELTVHEGHSSIEARSPENPRHVDRYRYRGVAASEGEPVRLSGRQKERLEAYLFDPRQVALERLDELKETALSRLGHEGAEVTHLIVDRDHDGALALRIYASSERESGYVRFDRQGKVVRVYR